MLRSIGFGRSSSAFVLLAVIGAMAAPPAQAEPRPLAPDAIRPAFSGTTIHVDAPLGSLVKITYELSRRVSLRLQTGSQSAVDIFYTFRFR